MTRCVKPFEWRPVARSAKPGYGGRMVIRKPFHVTVGPMCAGKTSALASRVDRLLFEGKSPRVFKPVVDARYGAEIRTHSGSHKLATTPIDALVDTGLHHGAIVVDEFQFLDPDYILDDLVELGKNPNVDSIWFFGLDLDARGKAWAAVEKVLPYATTVTKLTAVCTSCREPATMTQRVTPWPSPGAVALGGAADYEPRCVRCWGLPRG